MKPQLVVDWMDCISRQEDDFTECSFNGLCVEDVSKQNLSVNSCLFALIKRYVPEFAHGEDYIISFAIPDGSMIKD